MVFKQIQRESRPHPLTTDIVNSRSCVTDYLVYILKKSKNIFIKKKKIVPQFLLLKFSSILKVLVAVYVWFWKRNEKAEEVCKVGVGTLSMYCL